MKTYSSKDLYLALKRVGLRKGDTVYINPEIYKLGNLKDAKKRDDYYTIYFDTIFKILGKTGTIVINTYTFQTLRYNKRFVYEKTISSSGGFSEYIRKKKGALRSEHPVFSVTSFGKNNKKICFSKSISNYGTNSPYDNFLKIDGKILNIGMRYELNPFYHVAEFFAGVSYCYNKFTKIDYFKNKNKKTKIFSTFVMYKNLKQKRNYTKLKKLLKQKKMVSIQKLGSGHLFLIDAKAYFNLVKAELHKDQFFLFKKKLKIKKGNFPNA